MRCRRSDALERTSRKVRDAPGTQQLDARLTRRGRAEANDEAAIGFDLEETRDGTADSDGGVAEKIAAPFVRDPILMWSLEHVERRFVVVAESLLPMFGRKDLEPQRGVGAGLDLQPP